MIIGFQGAINSYNDFATDKFIAKLHVENADFRDGKIKKLPLLTSENVAKSLACKDIDLGVIAIKNNIAGLVKESKKILNSNLFETVDTIKMKIKHCLFAYNENCAKNLQIIASHPQAITQCKNYLKLHFPNCKLQEYTDTAKASKDLKNKILNKYTAVICSEKAGKESGLFLISKNIANKTSITTFSLIKLK